MKALKFIAVALITTLLVSCGVTRTVPITGRKQTIMVSDEQVLSLSSQEYANYMKTAKLSTNRTNTAMVKRVGQRLASAVEAYLKANGLASVQLGVQPRAGQVGQRLLHAWRKDRCLRRIAALHTQRSLARHRSRT